MPQLQVSIFEKKQLRKKRYLKTINAKNMRDLYEWYREQETYEYDIKNEFLYMPSSRTDISVIENLDS